MILSMLMVFILVVAMVVNVGQAVNRRIALQMVADTGAFTGASAMAEGLNYMAYANSVIQDEWAVFTVAFVAVAVLTAQCGAIQAAINTYKAFRAPFAVAYEVINRFYANWPYMEARRISELNVDQLFPGERGRRQFSFREVDLLPEGGLGTIPLKRDLMAAMESEQVPDGTRPVTDLPSAFNSRRRITLPCLVKIVPTIRTFNMDVWFRKRGRDVKYFVWWVRVKETKALMFNSFFGPIPPMTAVAVAKPVNGSLVRGESEYVTKLVPASKVMLGGGVVRDPFLTTLGGLRRVTH
jgi:hypothetical protein